MRRVATIAVVLIAALAASAIATGAASATKLTLTTEAGAALLPEEFIELTGYDNVDFRTPVGAIECKEPDVGVGIESNLLTNGKAVDALEVYEIMNGFFRGAVRCEGEAGYTLLELRTNGTIKFRGNGKATWGPFEIEIRFGRTNERCFYKAHQLTGSNTPTPPSQPLEVKFEHKLTLDKAQENTAGCPKYVEMTLVFNDNFSEDANPPSVVYEHTP